MRYQHHHLTDEQLVRALDGELPRRWRSPAAAHLETCAPCRARQLRVDRAADAFQELCLADASVDNAASGDSRNRLRTRMSAEAACSTSLPRRLAALASPLSALAGAAAAAVLIVRLVTSPGPAIDRDGLPVAALTPGATWDVSVGELCGGGAREQRPVPADIRQRVLRDYDMAGVAPELYELDYLIPPELGGAPDARNLWPQRYQSTVWNAGVKDELERLLPQLVCDRRLELQTAQRDLAGDWIASYKKYFRTTRPLVRRADRASSDSEMADELTYPIWRQASAPALKLVSFSVSR